MARRTHGRARRLSAALLGLLAGCGGTSRAQSMAADIGGRSSPFETMISANDTPEDARVYCFTVGGQAGHAPESADFGCPRVTPEGARPGTCHSSRDGLHATFHPGDGAPQSIPGIDDDACITMTRTAIDERGGADMFSAVRVRRDGQPDPPRIQVENGRFSASYNGR